MARTKEQNRRYYLHRRVKAKNLGTVKAHRRCAEVPFSAVENKYIKELAAKGYHIQTYIQ